MMRIESSGVGFVVALVPPLPLSPAGNARGDDVDCDGRVKGIALDLAKPKCLSKNHVRKFRLILMLSAVIRRENGRQKLVVGFGLL